MKETLDAENKLSEFVYFYRPESLDPYRRDGVITTLLSDTQRKLNQSWYRGHRFKSPLVYL